MISARSGAGDVANVDSAREGAQPRHRDVRRWLATLLHHAAVWMAGARTFYLPSNEIQRNAAARASMRLANFLVRRPDLSIKARALAGLVATTELIRHVLWDPWSKTERAVALPKASYGGHHRRRPRFSWHLAGGRRPLVGY